MLATPVRRLAVAACGCVLAGGTLAMLFAAGAAAQQATGTSVTVTGGRTIVVKDDGSSTYAATVSVQGATGPTRLSVRVLDRHTGDCVPTNEPVVRPGVETDVTFTLPATCRLAPTEDVEIVRAPWDATAFTSAGVTLPVKAHADNGDPPYHDLALGFGIGAAIAAVTVLFAGLARLGKRVGGEDRKAPGSGRWTEVLPGINKKWKWEDSPLANITIGAAVLTAVLGAGDVLKAVLGTDAPEVTVVLVAAAISGALIGTAPLALALLRNEPPEYKDEEDIPNNYTIGGVYASAAAVAAGALGFIGTVCFTLWRNSSIAQWALATGAGIAALLVIAHTARGTRRTFRIAKRPTGTKARATAKAGEAGDEAPAKEEFGPPAADTSFIL